mmetsp:Transcript_125751/g.218018  ORF Transcript_125751/g.218018 Transcript_125751/m.218018 type:complete len:116 (-) Transcript_125751:335-682(-)
MIFSWRHAYAVQREGWETVVGHGTGPTGSKRTLCMHFCPSPPGYLLPLGGSCPMHPGLTHPIVPPGTSAQVPDFYPVPPATCNEHITEVPPSFFEISRGTGVGTGFGIGMKTHCT